MRKEAEYFRLFRETPAGTTRPMAATCTFCFAPSFGEGTRPANRPLFAALKPAFSATGARDTLALYDLHLR